MKPAYLAAIAIAVASPLLPSAEALAKVGVASAVEGVPRGLPPAGSERTLYVGTDVEANEKVTTGANDRAHLVFLDGTSVTIGPEAELTIDRFVFDPASRSGDMALTMTKGTMRFVGGTISKRSEVRVDTPSASIGIRGGVFTLAIQVDGMTVANFLYGSSFSFTSGGVTRTTNQPNMQITATPGSPPSQPRIIPPGSIGPHFAAFNRSQPNSSGGPGTQRLASLVRGLLVNARLSQLNSSLTPAAARNSTPTPVQITARLTSLRGGPGGTQQAQATSRTVNISAMVTALAGKVDNATATSLITAMVAGDTAAVGAILSANAGNAATLTAMATAVTASGDAGMISSVVATSFANATVVGAVATAVAGTGNAGLIAGVVVASAGNATVVNAVGAAVANTGNATLVSAVTSSVAASSPTIAQAFGAAVVTANPSMTTAVTSAGVTPVTPPPAPPPPTPPPPLPTSPN